MRRSAGVLLLALLPILAGCAGQTAAPVAVYDPAPGINQVLSGAIEAAPGYELVVGDILTRPGDVIPPHYHYGEEFIYAIGGSAVIVRAGYPDVTLQPGEGLRVAPGLVHSGRNGPDGARVVSVWIKPVDKPLRVPVEP